MSTTQAEARQPLALVADDGKTNRLVLTAMLEKRGYRVVEAVDGKDAVRVFLEHDIDIVFMDVIMPEMDGYEATRAIKRICGDRFVPIMCITSLSQEESLGVTHTFESRHVPLAIQPESKFQARVESISFEPGGRLYLHTDGLVEIPDLDDDAEPLLLETLDIAFDLVQDRMSEARGRSQSHDDATLIEIKCTAPDLVREAASARVEDGAWDYTVRFDSGALRRVDLLPIVTPVMESMVPGLQMREVALTVLGELFVNALDHGVLGLSSGLKDGAGGFERYLAARAQALSDLDHGSVAVRLESEQAGRWGRICIKVSDSGPGFERNGGTSNGNLRPSGRGIALVEQLCSSVVYSERGNEVEAILNW